MPVSSIGLACAAILACTQPEPRELVIRPGTAITVKRTPEIRITALDSRRRRYEWNACSIVSDGTPRPSRWLGQLGIYDPAGRLFFPFHRGCEGITRTVVQEAQLHFRTEKVAEWWLSDRRRRPGDAVWTRNGLFVQTGFVKARQQLNVDVIQTCVAGHRPTNLAGSDDQALQVSESAGLYDCAQVPDSDMDETLRQLHDILGIDPSR